MKPISLFVLLASTAIALPTPAIAQKTPQRLFCEGHIYWGQGGYGQAVMAFSQAIKLNPRYAEAYFFRGLSHHEKGNYVAAIQNYNQALVLGYPRRDLIYKDRGHAFALIGDYKQAFEDLKLALSMKRDEDNYWAFAVVNFMNGNRQEAIRIGQKMAEKYYQSGERSSYVTAQEVIKIFRTAPTNRMPEGFSWLTSPHFAQPQTSCP
ncbi:hypothetical protein NIES2119_09905 [[Phormidium ambiguum] IAM M-71]|uniref:Uncharacterized protein n=1 Tax=[Phormidium ambiguum] IAM M-71 TaxID=454136 RepID=A0A1U7IM76_9CYAN|nr:tetratricopeptide repeat protein [Phormidium ambiguum]OKH38341.1 hypothetical protein NIES2119_09905 [Phormidium ambiguum IAM M-71]